LASFNKKDMPLSSTTLAKIVNGSAIPLFVLNKDHRVTHWNIAMEALTGRKGEEVIGNDDHWRSFYSEKRPSLADLIVNGASAEEVERYYQDKCKKSVLIEGAYEAEDFFPALGRKGRWLHFTASPIRDENGEIIGAIETLIDTTERKVLENNLRYYLQQITRAQEEERRAMSRELHDDMSQILGSLSRRLDNFLRKKPHLGKDEEAALQEIHNLLKQGLQSMNSFVQNLRPSLLDDLGLIPALRSLTNNIKSADIDVTFTVLGEERRFSGEIELSVFRIVQEALNNIRRHAAATQANVVAEFTRDGLKLTVSDNGQGFNAGGVLDDLPHNGKLGLMGMQERTWLLGGTMEIDSKPGEGTTLRFKIPAKK
jgi:two-component system sensor histidine kinase DegS